MLVYMDTNVTVLQAVRIFPPIEKDSAKFRFQNVVIEPNAISGKKINIGYLEFGTLLAVGVDGRGYVNLATVSSED